MDKENLIHLLIEKPIEKIRVHFRTRQLRSTS